MRISGSQVRLEVFKSERQLIDIEALRMTPKLSSLKLLDDALETADLVVPAFDDGGHVAHQVVQKADIGGQVRKVETHERF